jgi:hypothetical protein
MTDREQTNAKSTEPAQSDTNEGDDLPYSVVLWPEAGALNGKVLARAASIVLARAIYLAALTENPERRITLNRGTLTITDSREL